jgi:mannose-6-phosphate isomerase
MSTEARAHRLRGAVQRYAWGSRHVLAELLGRPGPSDEPEAELWLGAHPRGPALVEIAAGEWLPFDAVLARAPGDWLGPEVVAAHGERLPFLLKVLAVEEPLSLQVHPDGQRAADVFAADRERDPTRRRYADPHAKPELVCALTRFEALCGFRPADESRAWLAEAGLAGDWPEGPGGLRGFLAAWLRQPGERLARGLARLRAHAVARGSGDPVARRVLALAERWPGDPGLIAPVLMNEVELAPGEALFLPPGELHCYLAGVAVEIMGASDNVVRAGLTQKAIDAEEVLRVARCEPAPVTRVRPAPSAPGHAAFATPAREFELSRLEPGPRGAVTLRTLGPEILLCVAGRVEVAAPGGAATLGRGESCAVPAAARAYTVSGQGVVFRAAPPSGDPTGPPR